MRSRAAAFVTMAILLLLAGGSNLAAQTLEDALNDNVIQEIYLTVRASDWQGLRDNYKLDIYYDADFAWKYNGKLIGPSNASAIGIKSRGTGSRSPIKPSLKLDFNRNDPTQQFLGVNGLVLRNNSQDATEGLHERLTMLLASRLGLPVPREAHARLYINGQYFGLYTLVESIDNHYVQISLGESSGYLYKYTWVDPAYWFTYLGSSPGLYSASSFRFDPDNDLAKNNPQAAVFEPLFKAINQTSQSDSDYVSNVSQYVDLNALMTQLAVENFAADNDGTIGDWGYNNVYVYRFGGKNLHRFLMWDKSEAFQSLDFDIARHTDMNVLSKRLWAIPSYRKIYLDTLAKATALAGWLDTETQYEMNQIRADALADPNYLCKGPDGMPTRCTAQQFQDGNNLTKQFSQNRSANVKAQLANPPSAVAAGSSAYQPYELRALNAASFVPNDIAPGSLISIFGANLANSTAGAAGFPLPTNLAGVRVKINDTDAPLLYVSPNQVNLQVPYEVAPGAATITATLNGATTLNPPISTTINAASPGIFVPVHTDGKTPITPDNPAKANEVLVIYTNGLGAVSGNVVTGQPATALDTKTKPVVTVGGFPATVQYSGLTPGFAGLYQVNVQMPARVFASDRTVVTLSIGGQIAIPASISTR